MKMTTLFASSIAAVVALTLFDATQISTAQAARGSHHAAPVRSAPRVQHTVQPRTFKKPAVNIQKNTVNVQKNFVNQGNFKKTVPLVNVNKGPGQLHTGKAFGLVNPKTLPTFKPALNAGVLKGRVAVPLNLKPKLSLIKGPPINMKPRFASFMQRHWRRAFFWIAIAGIGYVTIPELYYDRFYSYVSLDDPDYDGAIGLLSLAALEEDQVVRAPMPTGVPYRYTAPVAPKPEARKACALEPFVERKWNSSYVYVKVPEVGNVTVPETDYDKFYGFVSAEPPNYPTACAVLTEAAAADTVVAGVQMATGTEN